MNETSDVSGAAAPPTGDVDPITATIEAVLADALAFTPTVVKAKKRVRKQDQQGNVAKTPKQDGEKTANDAEENDDDSSTAGNGGAWFVLLFGGFHW